MRKCKYIGLADFQIVDSVVTVFKTGDCFYYNINYSYNKTNPWYLIFDSNNTNITTFSRGEFDKLFIDMSKERKKKLKKLKECLKSSSSVTHFLTYQKTFHQKNG